MKVFFLISLIVFGTSPVWAKAKLAACVKKKEAILRSSPEKDSREVKKLAINTPLETTGKTKRNWIEVSEFDGKKSWIHRRDISYAKKCVLIKVSKSKTFDGPGRDFNSVFTAKKGEAFLDLQEGEDGWLHVEDSSGKKVWVNLDHIWRPTSTQLRMSFETD